MTCPHFTGSEDTTDPGILWIEAKAMSKMSRQTLAYACLGALLVCTLVAVQGFPSWATSSGSAVSDDWPMYRHDPGHTAHSASAAPNLNTLLWSYRTGNEIWSSPSVVGGRVYFGSMDNKTYCLDAITGTKIWEYSTLGPVFASPAVADGRLYIGSLDNKTYCLNALTGTRLWDHVSGGYVVSSPAVIDGRVYIGSYDHKVYCLDASTGVDLWNYTTSGSIYASPAVVDGRVYIASSDKMLYCLDSISGEIVWSCSITTTVTFFSSPAVANGRLYFGGCCYNASTGTVIWNKWAESSPALYNDELYIQTSGQVYCLNASTGVTKWTRSIAQSTLSSGTRGSSSSPSIADGKVFMGSGLENYREGGITCCLDDESGGVLWEYATGGYVASSPAIVDGVLYVGSTNGSLYALGAPTDLYLSNGFESGSFEAWTDTASSSGETASVVNTIPHHGNYVARFTSNGSDGYEHSYSSVDAAAAELYARGYYISQSGIMADNDRFFFIVFRSGTEGLAYAGWKRIGGITKWCITMRDGASYVDVYPSPSSTHDASPSTGQWYSVELHWKIDSVNGLAELYVNGSLACSSTGRDTSAYGYASRVCVGLAELSGCASTTVYCDCAMIASTYTGLEKFATMFDDGFESGSLSAWSGTSTSNGGTSNVTSARSHHGTYSAEFTTNGSVRYGYIIKKMTSPSRDLYARAYFYVSQSELSSDWDYMDLMTFKTDTSGSTLCLGWGIPISRTDIRWFLSVRGNERSTGAPVNIESPVTDRWYYVELYWSNDPWRPHAEVWVDGSQAYVTPGLEDVITFGGNVSEVRFGLPKVDDGRATVYCDCAAISNEHIGPETTGAVSSVRISLPSNLIKLGQGTVISGALVPSKPSSEVSIEYSVSESGSWNTLAIVSTNGSGRYSYEWTPTQAVSYDLRARWAGDAETPPTESPVITLSLTDGVIPEYQPLILVPLFALATLLVTFLSRQGRGSARAKVRRTSQWTTIGPWIPCPTEASSLLPR